jgi:hypothetical protein
MGLLICISGLCVFFLVAGEIKRKVGIELLAVVGLISHSTNNNLPSTVYFTDGIFSFLPSSVLLNRSRQMGDTSEYEKHIKGKIAQNKNKLVELGLTPISKLYNGKKSKYATRSATF